MTVTDKEASLSYSQMFKILTQFTGEIPLGIYRTDTESDGDKSSAKITIKEPSETSIRSRSKSVINSLNGLSFRNKRNKYVKM